MSGRQMSLPGFASAREWVLEGLPPGQRRFVEAFIQATAAALTAPLLVRRNAYGVNHLLVEKHRHDIIVERLIRLMDTLRRLDGRIKEAPEEERDRAYREAAKEIKALKDSPTNWEILLALSDASLEAPLIPEAVEEMKRAFAHCFGIERYVQVWGYDPIDLEKCRLLRYSSGHRGFPPLDEAEEAWVEEFNARLRSLARGEALAGSLFAAAEAPEGPSG